MQESKSNESRRTFIKGSTSAVAASALVSAIGSRAYAQDDDTLKIALIGCGGRGTAAAIQALSTTGPIKLVAMADAFEHQLPVSLGNINRQMEANKTTDRVDVPKERQFAGFDAYKKAIDVGVDGLVIATSPGHRPTHFQYAVEQGVNVFMEKPLASDPAGVRSILASNEIAKQKGLKVGVGLQRHHQLPYQETIKRLQDGEIGDINFMRAYWNGAGVWVRGRKQLAEKLGHEPTEMEYQNWNWYYFNWLCGDHIVEQHIHNIDVCNWIKGTHPVKAQGMGGREVRKQDGTGQIFDHFAIEFEYADGSIMQSHCRHQSDTFYSVSEHAHGSKGYCNVSGGFIKDNAGKRVFRFRGDSPNPYQVEHDVMWLNVRDNNAHNEADYGAHSTMTAILGRLAAYSGQLVGYDRALAGGVSEFPHGKDLTWDTAPPVLPDANGQYPVPVPGVYNPYAAAPTA